jgi:hypothetical protein
MLKIIVTAWIIKVVVTIAQIIEMVVMDKRG